MDALGLDVEETKGENLRGSGYWEAPRKRPDETGTAAAAAPAEGSRNYGAELDELRREVAALRREGHKGVSVASTEDWSGERGFLDDDARDLSPKTAKRLEHAIDEIELETSMWDASVYLGTPIAGSGGSILFALLLLFNIVLQFSFIAVIAGWYGSGMIDPSIGHEEIHDLRRWRRNTAHASDNYDKALDQSLARRVCDQDFALPISAFQGALYEQIVGYIGDLGKENGPGVYLCMLALTMWFMVLITDISDALTMIGAFLALPRGATKVRIDGSREVFIERLSTPRVAFAVAMQVVRLVIAGLLAYVGSVYLARTTDPGDLILNAVALEFILEADNLIFRCFAPKRFKALVKHCRPLRSPQKLPSRRGLNLSAVVALLAVLAALLGMYFGLVLPQYRDLRSAQDAMCAGDLDFIYATDAVGVPHWARTRKGVEKRDTIEQRNFPDGKSRHDVEREDPLQEADLAETYVETVVDTVLQQFGRGYFQDPCTPAVCDDYDVGIDYPVSTDPVPACCIPQKTELADPSLVVEAGRETMEETARHVNPSHIDIIIQDENQRPLAGTGLLELGLNAVVPDEACGGCPFYLACDAGTGTCVVNNCAVVARYCNEVNETGRRTRALCPETCGCMAGRYSPLALSLPNDGCGEVDTTGISRAYLDFMPCEDVDKDDPTFQAYLNNSARAAQALPGDKKNLALKEVEDLREHGCEFLSNPALWDNSTTMETFRRDAKNDSLARSPYFLGRSPCVRFAGSRAKPLSLFCPRACGCHRGDQDCPTTCPERDASDPLCPAWQEQIMPGPIYKDVCPRLPAAQPFDPGDGEDAGTAVG